MDVVGHQNAMPIAADVFALSDKLKQIEAQGLYRRSAVLESAQGVEIQIAGKRYLNFSSNDYLGLANHPEVVDSLRKALNHYGVGSGSAHLVCGHSQAHHALEEQLAEWTGRDRALLFSSGYMANLGVIAALTDASSAIFEDRLNHASLLDGGLLSRAHFQRYQHDDSADLLRRLNNSAAAQKLIVSDSVFSMDGDLANIPDLVACSQQSHAGLMIDDAHGLGVLGTSGAGSLQHFQLNQEQVPVLMGTLGKALGTCGAFVAGSEDLIEYLIQRARTFIYTTAMPPAIAAATSTAVRLVQQQSWRREQLQALIQRFQNGLQQLGIAAVPSLSAIQPVLIGDNQRALRVSTALKQRGFWVTAIRPPTVPKGTARLRITFSAEHQTEHVDQLLDALQQSLVV